MFLDIFKKIFKLFDVSQDKMNLVCALVTKSSNFFSFAKMTNVSTFWEANIT